MGRLRGDVLSGAPYMKDYPSRWIHSGLTCRDVADRASGYLSGSVPISTKVLIGLHLLSCPHCRTYVKQIDLVSSALRSLPKQHPSPSDRLFDIGTAVGA